MPKHFSRIAFLAASLIAGCALASTTGTKVDSAAATSANSEMDAPLFYQLLVGEMELRSGQPGVAFQVLLDAARRTHDEVLFQRVVTIAIQARAGDQALIAAKAWREAIPGSMEANKTTLQLLALLNRPAEVLEPLRALLAVTAKDQRGGVLVSLPILFQQAAEPKLVYKVLSPLLQLAATRPETKLAAKLSLARLALLAGETRQALDFTYEVETMVPKSDEPMQLALELMPSQPGAETLVTARLQAQADNHQLRLAYARALARAQRIAEAVREFRLITMAAPAVVEAWFGLGALELELRRPEAAEPALREYLQRLEGSEGLAKELDASRQQAWLMLAQVAEIRGDLKGAEAWLLKVDSPQRLVEAQFRRASLLARQGRLAEARKIIQTLPEQTAEETHAKFMAESQLLREARDWRAAYELLVRANERFPDDADMLYEQSMMAEKLGLLDEMEATLKRVTKLKPDHYHAYNALGFSLAERNLRIDEARELIAKALTYAPAEPFIVDSMGWVEYRAGNLAEALRLIRQAYSSRPDADIAAHLGELLWISGAQDEARKVWQEGARSDPRNESLVETMTRLKVKP